MIPPDRLVTQKRTDDDGEFLVGQSIPAILPPS